MLAIIDAMETTAQPSAPLKVVSSIVQQTYQPLQTRGVIHFSINTNTFSEYEVVPAISEIGIFFSA